jgi:hypothetical protein
MVNLVAPPFHSSSHLSSPTVKTGDLRRNRLILVAAPLPLQYILIVSPGTINRYRGKTGKSMSKQSLLHTKSTKLKNALTWMAESVRVHPEKNRRSILQEAELRFDLTPAECEFLDQHFSSP